jgi:cytochrome c-type biogenesis protein CcmE
VLAPHSRNWLKKPDWLTSPAWARVAVVAFVAFAGGMVLQSLQQNSPHFAPGPLAEVSQASALTEERARGYLLEHLRYSNSNAMQGMQILASAAQ